MEVDESKNANEPIPAPPASLSITTTHTAQKTQKVTTKILEFTVIWAEGAPTLKIKEGAEKKTKDPTYATLNKYKSEVIEELLITFFRYEIPKKATKKSILNVLCSMCGIVSSNAEELLVSFLNNELKKEITDDLMDEDINLLVDLREYVQNHSKLPCNASTKKIWDKTYFAFFLSDEHDGEEILSTILSDIWKFLYQTWAKDPRPSKFNSATLAYRRTFDDRPEFFNLKNLFAVVFVQGTYKHWTYNLILNLTKYFHHLLHKILIKIIMDKYKKKKNDVEPLSPADKDYICYSFAGAACNSLFRMYYGLGYKITRKTYLLQIVKQMVLNYHQTGVNLIPHFNISGRLFIENRGGYRVINKEWIPFVEKIMNILFSISGNLILQFKGNLKIILTYCLDSIKYEEFKKLIDKKVLKIAITTELKKRTKFTNNQDQTKNDHEQTDVKVDETKLEEELHVVFNSFVKGIITRYLWSYLKKMKSKNEYMTLRNKLKIFHMMLGNKFSSLQIH